MVANCEIVEYIAIVYNLLLKASVYTDAFSKRRIKRRCGLHLFLN